MELGGSSHGLGARPGTGHGVRNARDQRIRRPGPAGVPLHAGRPRPAPVPAGAPPTSDAQGCGPAAAADQQQADYFVRLLTQNRRLIDQRIDEYRKAVAVAEAKGDVDGARTFKRMTFTEQQDRQAVDGMIEGLRRRFPRQTPKHAADKPAPSLTAN